jgi:hypothetical protein
MLHGSDTKTGSTTENRSRRETYSERIDIPQIAPYLSFFGFKHFTSFLHPSHHCRLQSLTAWPAKSSTDHQ